MINNFEYSADNSIKTNEVKKSSRRLSPITI